MFGKLQANFSHKIPFIILTPGVELSEFVKEHPCEVWDSMGNFYGRFQTMKCAANTAQFTKGSCFVLDRDTKEVWDMKRCAMESRI